MELHLIGRSSHGINWARNFQAEAFEWQGASFDLTQRKTFGEHRFHCTSKAVDVG